MTTRVLILLLLSTLIGVDMTSQTVSWKNYTTSDGLISNIIYDMALDQEGYLWLSTDNGLAKYNGEEFKHFGFKEGLPDNEILKTFCDQSNRVWALCYNGRVVAIENDTILSKIGKVALAQLESPTFYLGGYDNGRGQIFLTQWNNGVYVADEDTVYHTMQGHSINSYFEKNGTTHCITRKGDGMVLQVWDVLANKKDTSLVIKESVPINTFAQDEQNLYFIGESLTQQEAFMMVFNKSTSQLDKYPFLSKREIRINYLTAIDGTLYVSTYYGLFATDLSTKQTKKIDDQVFTKVLQDRQGNIWLGSIGQGLSVIKTNGNLSKTIASGSIEKMAYDAISNKLIYGTATTMNEWNLTTNDIQTHKEDGGLRLYDILVDGNSTYFCFNDKIIKKTGNEFESIGFSSKRIIKDSYSDSLIVGSSFGLTKCLTIDQASIDPTILVDGQKIRALDMVQLTPKHLLVGSNDRLYHYQKGKYIRDNLVDTRVNNIYLDTDRRPIIVSELEGVLYHMGTDVQHLNSNFEIPLGSITASCYTNDTLWLATDYGIHFITKSMEIWNAKSYPYNSNVVDRKVNDLVKIGSQLYLATHRGIVTFSPSQYQRDTFPALLSIKSIKVNGKYVPIQEKLSLSTNERNLVLSLETLKFLRSDVQYHYSMDDGLSWQSTSQPELIFANLSPNDYQIKIYAQELSGVKSNTLSLALHVAPPYYKSMSFYLLCGGLLLLLIYAVYKVKLNRVKRDSQIERQLSSSQQKALRAQMNPHFLFNALNSIQQFFLEDNDLDGQEYISKFSRLVRNTLDNSEKDLQLVNEELENLERYVELEQLRLHHSFAFNTIVDPAINVMAAYIPSMILQPIVENCIWHGIQHRRDTAGQIEVHIELITKKRLRISVSDNGVGRSKSAMINNRRSHHSQGTSLIKQRIEAINGARNLDIQIEIKNNIPQGTVVTIETPIIDEYTYSR